MAKPITEGEFPILSSYIQEISGIALDRSKIYLIESRIGPLVDKYGCSSYVGLYRKAKDEKNDVIKEAIIDAISTNETSFFRDQKPFDLIKHKLIPDLLEETKERYITIWCAACSSGQECYSVCMVLKEILFDLTKYNINILSTDISEEALAQASRGVYSNFDISRGLSQTQIYRYFDKDIEKYRIKDELRYIIKFQKANLFNIRSIYGYFDIILCRNVAVYFEQKDRNQIFKNLTLKLKPKGSLIIGSTESLMEVSHYYQRQNFHGAVYYTLKEGKERT